LQRNSQCSAGDRFNQNAPLNQKKVEWGTQTSNSNLKTEILLFGFLQPLFQFVYFVFHALREMIAEFFEVVADQRDFG